MSSEGIFPACHVDKAKRNRVASSQMSRRSKFTALPAFFLKTPAQATSPLLPGASAENTSSPKIDSGSAPPNGKESPQFDHNSQSSAPPQDKLELQVLVEPTSSVDSTISEAINIIFVHGLGGRSCKTWTNEGTSFFWPASLPKAKGLEHLRVMTFGYDATWQNMWKIWQGQTQLDIANFASQLLNRLRVHYDEYPDVGPALR